MHSLCIKIISKIISVLKDFQILTISVGVNNINVIISQVLLIMFILLRMLKNFYM